ncbi:MAG TPA: gluconate 2-dehydrogenase subunit 3 family protein [Pseudomonadales bacterium]|nr:gluconate 2-dehydrogenase subunit 3 family protein [Pseudomonadales bacterium]
MNRRELLKMIAAATGASFIGADALAYVELPPATALEHTDFSKQEYLLWEAICDTVMPRTETPGAVDAGTPAFTLRFVFDCYESHELVHFKAGLADIEARSQTKFGHNLATLAPEQRFSLLSELDRQAHAFNRGEPAGQGAWSVVVNKSLPHYFTLMKQVILFGFFTSEVGATQVLRYVSIPGRYDGDFAYQQGDKAWAPEY